MKSVISDNSENISDIKRARQLLSSVTQTNRQHPPGWLAAARLEEHAGKMTKARQVIMEACRACPDSEDVWIEAARLHVRSSLFFVLSEKSLLALSVLR